MEAMPSVAGRFEVLDTGDRPYSIILDYAHTPDSLESTLLTVKTFGKRPDNIRVRLRRRQG